jgi:D-mannonate dehydratase
MTATMRMGCAALKLYEGIDRMVLRSHFKRFLDEVVPTAEELGMRFACIPTIRHATFSGCRGSSPMAMTSTGCWRR